MTPSMKQGSYDVYLLLERTKEDGQYPSCYLSVCCRVCVNLFIIILLKHYYYYFTCRKSASCTHISVLLHALAAMTPVPFPVASSSILDDEDANYVPITSLPCQCKQPRKRKESNVKMSDATFEKHIYG